MNEEYLKTLEKKLTGNIDEDFKFLLNEALHFQKLELLDVVNEIFKLFEKKYPNEGKQYLLNQAKKAAIKRKEKFDEVLKLEQQKEWEKAQELIVNLIDTFPIKKRIEDGKIFKSFLNLFENLLYEELYNKDHQKVYRLEEPYSLYYFHLAYILFNLDDLEGALDCLDTSIRYNDISPDAYFLKADIYYKLGRIDEFFNCLDMAHKHTYSKYQLINYYLHLLQYFTDIGDKKVSSICLFLLIGYGYNDMNNRLKFQKIIDELEGDDIDPQNIELMKETLEKKNIQFGPNLKVLRLLKNILNDDRIKADLKLQRYFLNIAYSLTNDSKIFKRIKEIDKILKEKESEKNSHN